MGFEVGQTIVRRYFRGGFATWVQAARVLGDDEVGLRLWVPVGAGFACRIDAAGRRIREVPLDVLPATRLTARRWDGHDVLVLVPPGAAHSVWWFFDRGGFQQWYVNLEDPCVRWERDAQSGIDTVDHGLDIVATPDRAWRWKDEDELAALTGRPGFWTGAQARAIRAEGERVAATIEAGVFPFDGTWCDFRPDPSWPRPELPAATI